MISYMTGNKDLVTELNLFFDSIFYPKKNRVTADTIGDYVIAFDGYCIVGACGIRKPEDSEYEDYELVYTAVHSSYRNQGIATQLVKLAIVPLTGNIYCSAWRTWDNPGQAHMHSVLTALGFTLIEKPHMSWNAEHYCKNSACSYANTDKAKCICWEDTYLLAKES